MTSTTAPATQARCLRCGRKIKSGTYGPKCAAMVREANRAADLSAWTPTQVEDARQAIEDGAVVPSNRDGVFHVVSSDGSEVHLTALHGCNCENGLKTRPSRPCYHRCAIAIITASHAPVDAKPAAPVVIPAPAPASDMWAEIERLNDAFMAAA